MTYQTTGAGHPGVKRAKFTNGVINCSAGAAVNATAVNGAGNVQDIDFDGVHLMGTWSTGFWQANGSSGDALRWAVEATIEDGNSMVPAIFAFDGAITESGNGRWTIPGHTNGVETFSAASTAVIASNFGKLATAIMKVHAVDNQSAGISAKRSGNNQFTITASGAITGDVYWEIAHP